MAEMTRDDLRELRARALGEQWAFGGGGWAKLDKLQRHMFLALAEATMKAEDAAGLAVVQKEATGEMIDAYYYANPGKLVRHLEKAIATGNLLKEK